MIANDYLFPISAADLPPRGWCCNFWGDIAHSRGQDSHDLMKDLAIQSS